MLESLQPHHKFLQAKKAVCPPLLSKFQQSALDKTESQYHSKRTAPLGAIHDQTQCLPEGMDITTTTFGKKTFREDSVGKTVNPPKSMEQVDKEYFEGSELYKKVSNKNPTDWNGKNYHYISEN